MPSKAKKSKEKPKLFLSEIEVKIRVMFASDPSPKHEYKYAKAVEMAVGNVPLTKRYQHAETKLLSFRELTEQETVGL